MSNITRILVVDDDPDERTLIEGRLRDHLDRIEIDIVGTCAAAVSLTEKNHYDAAIVDLILTGDYWTGIELCDYIERKGIPTVLVCSEPSMGKIFGFSRPVKRKLGPLDSIIGTLREFLPNVALSNTPSVQFIRARNTVG